jgi:hypothetical protein
MEVGRTHNSITLEADAEHLMTDVWTSAGVIAGVGLVWLSGWLWLDPAIALLVAANIVWTGWRLMQRSAAGLMDVSLPAAKLEQVEAVLAGYRRQGLDFHALRTRQAGSRAFVILHVLVPGHWSVQQGHDWAERIEAYEKEVISLKGALASEDLQGLPQEAPDGEAVDGALAAADANRVRALERLSEARGTLQDIARLAEQHRQGEETARGLQEQAELVVGVAERCQGKAAPYISLQRWVLSAYLDDICRYANQRLELMTSSRYPLRLSDEGGRGGRQAGLGLRVLDAYTGEEREVNSLSGGETFQASLALALAVADVVEARTGGLHLEALFIDEGFGTLDPENLQLAMDELDRLREGGRMIGIISHVGALKERIRAGIEVSAGETGSRARVVRTVME